MLLTRAQELGEVGYITLNNFYSTTFFFTHKILQQLSIRRSVISHYLFLLIHHAHCVTPMSPVPPVIK